MKSFISEKPVLFAIGITVIVTIAEYAVAALSRLVGLPEPLMVLLVLSVSVAIPFALIHRLGWWQDAGFVTTVQNLPSLTIPFLLVFIPLPFFGAVTMEPLIAVFITVAFFLTALSEEALMRGLLFRVFLPQSKWIAVLVPSVLFGIAHITQFFEGMALTDNLLQIANAIIFGVLYAAVRLRVNSIWPLVALHMLFDEFAAIAGIFGPAATGTISDVPGPMWAIIWVLSLATALYLIRKPSTATIDGVPVG